AHAPPRVWWIATRDGSVRVRSSGRIANVTASGDLSPDAESSRWKLIGLTSTFCDCGDGSLMTASCRHDNGSPAGEHVRAALRDGRAAIDGIANTHELASIAEHGAATARRRAGMAAWRGIAVHGPRISLPVRRNAVD